MNAVAVAVFSLTMNCGMASRKPPNSIVPSTHDQGYVMYTAKLLIGLSEGLQWAPWLYSVSLTVICLLKNTPGNFHRSVASFMSPPHLTCLNWVCQCRASKLLSNIARF